MNVVLRSLYKEGESWRHYLKEISIHVAEYSLLIILVIILMKNFATLRVVIYVVQQI